MVSECGERVKSTNQHGSITEHVGGKEWQTAHGEQSDRAKLTIGVGHDDADASSIRRNELRRANGDRGPEAT